MESIHFHRNSVQSLRAGFTLIELLVVMGIVFTLSLIMLTNQSSFNKTLILANTAYDVALTLRTAQTYGLGSKVSGGIINSNAGYGINLQKGVQNSFTMFTDTYPAPNTDNCHGAPRGDTTAPDALPGNCSYDASQGETFQTYTLGNGIKITNVCLLVAPSSWYCSLDGAFDSLDIVFARPNPGPFINRNGSNYSASYIGVCFVLTSPQGGNRYISIANSGEINANANSCP